MKRCLLTLGLLMFTATLSPAAEPPQLDEHSRLMQAYMAVRAEWTALRHAALTEAKTTQDKGQKQRRLSKLAADEKPVLARLAIASRAYEASLQSKREQLKAAKPRD